jgi:hypothetical protein
MTATSLPETTRRGFWESDLPFLAAFLILALIFFFPVTLGGKTMLPADNAFSWEPWKTYSAQVGVGLPHNDLLGDLYLENYAWKRFIVQSLRQGQMPLWNPYIVAGVPFLAAGQHSALYPLSVLFYVLPIPAAYGWYAAIHMFLMQVFAYFLARALRVGRWGSALTGVTLSFCGFVVANQVFPMITAAITWWPVILTAIVHITDRAAEGQVGLGRHVRDVVVGAFALAMVFLAGHPEMYYYVAVTCALFALWRLVRTAVIGRRWTPLWQALLVLGGTVLVGAALGAVQWLPLMQLAGQNFREGSTTFKDVLGWAYVPRQVISMFIPDFFGNPTHHSYFDLFTWKTLPVTTNALHGQISTIFWGMKNYVEAASYVGFLPIVLAVVAVLRRKSGDLWFWLVLSVLSLLFTFGSRLYIIVYKLPGLNQVHSPFRWVMVYSLGVSLLAGMGLDTLLGAVTEESARARWWQRLMATLTERVFSWGIMVGAVAALVGLGISLAIKERFASLAQRMLDEWALANQAFADWRMLYSYEFRNVLIFAIVVLVSGVALFLFRRLRRSPFGPALLILVVVGELYAVGHSFFPAVDPGLVGYRTPAIDFLKKDPELYRITTFVPEGGLLFNANMPMIYDIPDVRGYDSIIPRQYARFMEIIQYQSELLYNRIAPIFYYSAPSLNSRLLDLLNVKYVMTEKSLAQLPARNYTLVYDGEVRIYRNDDALPRAFLVPAAELIPVEYDRRIALADLEPLEKVILEEPWQQTLPASPPRPFPYQVEKIEYTPNEVRVTCNTPTPAFLVLGDTYFEGWQATFYTAEGPGQRGAGQALHIYRADGNFRAVELPAGHYVVRFRYAPTILLVGAVVSALALVVWGALVGWALLSRGRSRGRAE